MNNIEKYSQMRQDDIKLFEAIEKENVEAVKTALDNGASPNAIEPSTNFTPKTLTDYLPKSGKLMIIRKLLGIIEKTGGKRKKSRKSRKSRNRRSKKYRK